MDYVHIDESRFPIVVFDFSSREPTFAEFEAYLKKTESYYAREIPLSFILDGTKSRFLTTELRIRQAQWMKDNAPIIKKYQKGIAFILPNIMSRIILKGILLIEPIPAPFIVVSSFDEALQWTQQQLANGSVN